MDSFQFYLSFIPCKSLFFGNYILSATVEFLPACDADGN